MKPTSLSILTFLLLIQMGSGEPLFTQKGTDPSFAEVMKSGKLAKGKESKVGVSGSVIDVKNDLVETTPEAKRPFSQAIKIHTLGSSVIPRGDFKNGRGGIRKMAARRFSDSSRARRMCGTRGKMPRGSKPSAT